uniref:Tail specific protease domain-containing protein n=1 Tax=Bionectria ochroleuca TaxID=29856 RepID=A0A8H7N164_BIOOC
MRLTISTTAQSIQLDPCQIVASQQVEAQSKVALDNPQDFPFKVLVDAENAYQCYLSIPIENEKAVTVLEYQKEVLSMYSTLAFMKNPPKSYQQPGIDVLSRVDEMIDKAKNGSYNNLNEYASDWSAINIAAYDTHFTVSSAGTSLFYWILPEDIVSVSIDGKALPQVYAYNDIANNVSSFSPIVELNRQSIFDYLQTYLTKTYTGMLDPHAEWNALMYSAAGLFSRWGSKSDGPNMYYGAFRLSLTYNGPSVKGKFANGTQFEWKYMAGAISDFTASEISSGQQIYDKLVLKKTSEAGKRGEEMQKRELVDQNASAASFPTSVPYPSYPKTPIVVQRNFTRGGTISGYLLAENSTGVLSLPSFEANKNNELSSAREFNVAVADFIHQCREAGTKKIVIDVTGNGGGTILLGYDTFRQFFPKKDPEALARSRATPYWNTYGSIISGLQPGSKLYDELTQGLAGAPDLNSSTSLSVDSERWSSWKDYFGPVNINQDNFTRPYKYDFSTEGVVQALSFNITGYGDRQPNYDEAFPSEDIIIVYDGACGSTCSIFANMMKNIGGVKSIAVGGIPQNGPMQGIAGTRGSQVRRSDVLDMVTKTIQENLLDSGNQTNEALRSKLGVTAEDIEALPLSDGLPWALASVSVNTVDAVMKSKEEVPYQFAYEAANCRLFYTMDMIRDVTKLWEAAARVAGGDTSDCVPGSVNGPGSGINEWLFDSPGFSNADIWGNANSTKLLVEEKSDENNSSSASGMLVSLSMVVTVLTMMWAI